MFAHLLRMAMHGWAGLGIMTVKHETTSRPCRAAATFTSHWLSAVTCEVFSVNICPCKGTYVCSCNCRTSYVRIYFHFATTILFCCCCFQVRDQFCSNKTASQFILLLFCRFCNFKTCKSCNYKGVRLFKSCDAVNFAFRFGSCESTVGKLSL